MGAAVARAISAGGRAASCREKMAAAPRGEAWGQRQRGCAVPRGRSSLSMGRSPREVPGRFLAPIRVLTVPLIWSPFSVFPHFCSLLIQTSW